MTKFLTPILLGSLFCLSCSNNDRQKETDSTKDTASVAVAKESNTIAASSYVTFDKDSVTVLPFEIDISLSPTAKEKIVNSQETIIIDVSLTGTPKDATLYSNDGTFYVASVEKEIAYGQVAKFDNIKFSKETFDQLTGTNFLVTVNVVSGRKSSPDNLLNCDFVEDSISNLVNKRLTIKGKLNGDD